MAFVVKFYWRPQWGFRRQSTKIIIFRDISALRRGHIMATASKFGIKEPIREIVV